MSTVFSPIQFTIECKQNVYSSTPFSPFIIIVMIWRLKSEAIKAKIRKKKYHHPPQPTPRFLAVKFVWFSAPVPTTRNSPQPHYLCWPRQKELFFCLAPEADDANERFLCASGDQLRQHYPPIPTKLLVPTTWTHQIKQIKKTPKSYPSFSTHPAPPWIVFKIASIKPNL